MHGKVIGREVKNHMGTVESIVHALLIMVTFGCWYPFYRLRKKSIERTTTIYSA